MSHILDLLDRAQQDRKQQTPDRKRPKSDAPAAATDDNPLKFESDTSSSFMLGSMLWLTVLCAMIVGGFALFQYHAYGVEPMTMLRGYFPNI